MRFQVFDWPFPRFGGEGCVEKVEHIYNYFPTSSYGHHNISTPTAGNGYWVITSTQNSECICAEYNGILVHQ